MKKRIRESEHMNVARIKKNIGNQLFQDVYNKNHSLRMN